MALFSRLARPHTGEKLSRSKKVVLVTFDAKRLKRISSYDLDKARQDYKAAARMVETPTEPCEE